MAAPVSGRRPAASAPVDALGLCFPSPLLLAAGFDKNAEHLDGLLGLGFGAVEVGTVTALPQPGNPRPRLFRLPDDLALINRMGFNNHGADAVAARLARWRDNGRMRDRIVGVNIGKSKITPVEDAAADYRASAELLGALADYLVVNVSSPNTPGLRSLQARDELEPIIDAVREGAGRGGRNVPPLLVKIAPDLTDDEIVAVADLALETGLDGLVATNTTTSRDGLRSSPAAVGACGEGGLSGVPLRGRSIEVLDLLVSVMGARCGVVSVGGIETAADVQSRLGRGAVLTQAYSGFIYGGPLWPRRIAAELAAGR